MGGFATTDGDRSDLLLLDLDGTIADICAEPDDAMVDADCKCTLQALVRGDPLGLVVVTGRSLADADRMLHPLELPTIASHGAEVRVPGYIAPVDLMPIGGLRGAIEALVAKFPEVRVEWKPFSAAIHVRSAPALLLPVREAVTAFARVNPAFRVQSGRLVFEIVPAGVSKAGAVGALLQLPGYRSRRAVYVGDDHADEAAMDVVQGFDGTALRVEGEHFGQADSQFDGAHAVRAWLASLAERSAAFGEG